MNDAEVIRHTNESSPTICISTAKRMYKKKIEGAFRHHRQFQYNKARCGLASNPEEFWAKYTRLIEKGLHVSPKVISQWRQ